MKRELPSRPSLEYLRKEAKQLLDQSRSNDPEAIERLKAVTTSGRPSLHHAQLALAREYGSASWRDLVTRVRTSETDGFLGAVCGDRWDRATKIKPPPEHVRLGSIHVAAACGDILALEHLLTKDRRLANQKGGPLNKGPLLYLCFSRMNRGREELFAECAKYLISHGADVNESFIHPSYPDSPLPVLYGAAGVVFNPDLTDVLIERGANVNDNESLYHSTESRNHDCLKLLLAAKPKIEGTNALYRMLDYDDLEGLRILIDAGADLNEPGKEGALNHAIRRSRSRAHLDLLLFRGADPERKSNEGWTPHQLALRTSNLDAAKLLEERGFADPLSDQDQFVIACMSGDLEAAQATGVKVDALRPSDLDALVAAAWNEKDAAVKTMLAVGFPVGHRETTSGNTALHCACWKGSADIVEALLEKGAPLDLLDHHYQATPIGWACHGSMFAKDGDGRPLNRRADYPRIVKALLEAGAPLTDDLQGSDEVNEVVKAFR